jgi:hypothetical protein
MEDIARQTIIDGHNGQVIIGQGDRMNAFSASYLNGFVPNHLDELYPDTQEVRDEATRLMQVWRGG